MNLTQRIAQAMATGAVDRIPRLTRHASPEAARALLEACYRLRDAVEADQVAGSMLTLQDRIAVASVRLKVSAAIDETHAWLRRCAKHGGMSVAVGCRGDAPAETASRPATSAVAGEVLAGTGQQSVTRPADPLFSCPGGQYLPPGCSPVASQNTALEAAKP